MDGQDVQDGKREDQEHKPQSRKIKSFIRRSRRTTQIKSGEETLVRWAGETKSFTADGADERR